MICTAEEPEPMTATRLPLRETDVSQLALWSIGPWNDSRPAILGQTHLLRKGDQVGDESARAHAGEAGRGLQART